MTTVPAGYADAISAYRGGDLHGATSLLEQCAREAPDHAPTAFGLGLCLEGLGDRSAALGAYRRATGLEPGHVNAHVKVGELLERSGDVPAAVEAYRAALALRPDASLAARVARLAAPSTPSPAEAAAARPASLADLLDGEDAAGSEIGGPVITSGHRRAASYRSLWVGAALVLVLPLVPLAVGMLHAPLASLPSPARRAAVVALDVLWVAQFAVLAAAVLLLLLALVRGRTTTYVVRARRFEVQEGLLVRKQRIVWVHEVSDLTYRQSLLERLAGTASLVLTVDDSRTTGPTLTLAGFGRADDLSELVATLHPVVLHERRAMKKQFL